MTNAKCPFCETAYNVYYNVCEHPNSMYSIRSCEHINIARCASEKDALDELRFVLEQYASKGLIVNENTATEISEPQAPGQG